MRRIVAGIVVVGVLGLAGWAVLRDRAKSGDDDAGDELEQFAARQQKRLASRPGAAPSLVQAAHARDHVVVSGTVIDRHTTLPVSGVEVVFTSQDGETSTEASSAGEYSIELPRGTYRAFVRDDNYISIGAADHIRVPHAPSPDVIGVPDEARMPVIVALADVSQIELPVVAVGKITGTVMNADGEPVSGATVEARGGEERPVLGSQVAETDSDGHFELRVAEGDYTVAASHPRYATATGDGSVTVTAGSTATSDVELWAGCVISGRVVKADGSPAPEGALDMISDGASSMGPVGLIQPDGTFRWTTEDEVEVDLRAWPWKSPPSEYKHFNCTSGARFEHVTFVIPDREPDITGRLVDANGNPVPFAYLDLMPEDPSNIGQQERTDENGIWHVYAMPPGRYRVEVAVTGKGVVTATVVSPSTDNELRLSGTGRIEGTTTNLAEGSFEVSLDSCDDGRIELARQTRLVSVVGGQFAIEDVPACDLRMRTRWHERSGVANVPVERGQTAHVEIDVGPRRIKHVHGVVRDSDGRPVASAVVRVVTTDADANDAMETTDGTGRFELDAPAGATLEATSRELTGSATVGLAAVKDEDVEISLTRGW